MSVDESPIAPSHEYELVASDTPVSDDGYKLGEPKKLECVHCDARMVITSEKTPGLWSVDHEPWCPNGD